MKIKHSNGRAFTLTRSHKLGPNPFRSYVPKQARGRNVASFCSGGQANLKPILPNRYKPTPAKQTKISSKLLVKTLVFIHRTILNRVISVRLILVTIGTQWRIVLALNLATEIY